MECQFCRGGLDFEKVCGELHSVVNKNCNCVAHQKCMQYSSNLQQFKFPQFGGFYIEHVEIEVKRGLKLMCSVCKRKGATAGCAFKDCKRTYHYPCAIKAKDVLVRRFVRYASQDIDAKSTVILYCIFCSSSHQNIYTKNLLLASDAEVPSSSEDDVEADGLAEGLSHCATNGEFHQQLSPKSPLSDDNGNIQNKQINQVDSSTCIAGEVPLPMRIDANENFVGTSSVAVNKNAVGNSSILDAAVPATPLSLARRNDRNLEDYGSESDCRRDRLCLKSSQRKRKLREMAPEDVEAAAFEPQDDRPDDCINWNSSYKRARIDSSPETLYGTQAIGIGVSPADTATLNNGCAPHCVGESAFVDGFLPTLNIPDPMDDQIHLKNNRNLPSSSFSSRMKNRKLPDPHQPMITSFLTPSKKVDMTVTKNCTTEVSKITKDKPKVKKRLQLSGINARSNENFTQTRLINEAESIEDDFEPLSSSILPMAEMNVSPTKIVDDTSPITDVTIIPNTEVVSAAKEAFVSSVSSDSSEHVMNASKKSTSKSGILELPSCSRIMMQNLPSTIRKLVLDGRGNFSQSPEIESLLQPQSDSSNDTRESSESCDSDSNDLGWNCSSEPLSLSLEELSSTLFLHPLEDNADVVDQVFGLCIPVTEESLDDRTSKAFLKYGICSLGLVEENIFLWQITGLNDIQIISLILQFSQYLRDKNELELLKKLFKQKNYDADIVLDDEIQFTKENVEAIRQEIAENFSEAEKNYGRCVGKLCNFDDLRISAAFLILSNTNDNTRAARSSLPRNHRVHQCSKDTKFVISYNLSEAQRRIISDNEFENLKWWLETFDYSTVLFYPTENILQSLNAPSVTNRLKNYFMQRTVPGGDTNFVFIQQTNPDLLVYRRFICKLLAFVKEELLTCNHDACIVFDVGLALRIERLVDVVMPCLVGDQGTNNCFEVKAFSGTNPSFSPVSCLVIHLQLKFTENC